MDRRDVSKANQLVIELDKYEMERRDVVATATIRLEVPRSWSNIYVGNQGYLSVGEIGDDKVMTPEGRLARELRAKALEYYDEKISRLRSELRALGVLISEEAA